MSQGTGVSVQDPQMSRDWETHVCNERGTEGAGHT